MIENNNDIFYKELKDEGVSLAELQKDYLYLPYDPLANTIFGNNDSLLPAVMTNDVIVVFTGAFDPFHDGHKAALMQSISIIENNGYKVHSSIVCPDTDEYVKRKRPEAADFDVRVDYANKMLKDDSNVYVDNGTNHLHYSPNLTAYITRFQKLAEEYNYYPTVFTVLGSDNAGFIVPILSQPRTGAVIINRNNAEITNPRVLSLLNSNRVFISNHNDNTLANYSSTMLRKNGFNYS